MKQVFVDYGDSVMPTELPDSAIVVKYGEYYQDLPPVDPVHATRQVLARPLGTPPLKQAAKPQDKVVIAFPDRVKGGFHRDSHRRVSIPLIVQELKEAGVSERNITLVCAMGLHRKNTKEELCMMLGQSIVDAFWPDRLLMHDGEDPDGMVALGTNAFGHMVDLNRAVAEADIAILVGHVLGNPYGGYSGGYKMCATGLTSWRSIRHHHAPSSMYSPHFLPANHDQSPMRRQFDAVGQRMEEAMGKPFFVIDAVLGAKSQVLGVFAGRADQVQKKSWELADRRTNVTLKAKEKVDVVVFGEPRSFHYGPGMGTNPILMLQAVGGELARVYDVFNDGGVFIVAAQCDGWFNDEWFPSYREVYDLFQKVCDQEEMTRFEDQIAHNAEYIYRYRHAYAYHPWHALSMIYMGGLVRRHTSAVFIAGAREPGYARGMGCIPTATVDDALKQAEKYVGRNPRVLYLPELFKTAPVHLKMEA